MQLKKTVLTTILLVLSTAIPVLANQPPGPQVILSEILILPAMIIFSMIGGAYAVLSQIQKKNPWVLLVVLSILAILLSGMQEGIGALVAITFGVIALQRGVRMIMWGFHARSNHEKPEHLIKVKSWLMIPSSVFLVTITFFLVGMAVAFVGYWPEIGHERREKNLKEFITRQIAYRQLDKSKKDELFGGLVEIFEDKELFTTYMLPSERFPLFPYNYLTTQSSYRADETGQIRMIRVHKKEHLCPADAPVVMKIGKKDIQRVLNDFLAGEIDPHELIRRPQFIRIE